MRQARGNITRLGAALLGVAVTFVDPVGVNGLTCPHKPKAVAVPEILCMNDNVDVTVEIEPAAGATAVEVVVSIVKPDPNDPGDAVIVVDGTEYHEHTIAIPAGQAAKTIQIRGKEATKRLEEKLALRVCTCSSESTPSCKTAEFEVGAGCNADMESVGGCPGTTVEASMRIENKADCQETFAWVIENDPFGGAVFSFSPESGNATLDGGAILEDDIEITIPVNTAPGIYSIYLRSNVDGQRKCAEIPTVAVGDATNPPADCGGCTGNNAISQIEVPYTTGACDNDECGITLWGHPDTQVTNATACFEGCTIHFRVQATREVPSDPCTELYTEIPGSALTAANYCAFATFFDSQLSGHGRSCFIWDQDLVSYGNTECIEVHEDAHVALQQAYINRFLGDLQYQPGMAPVPVSGNPPTPTCTSALTPAKESDIAAAVDYIFVVAGVAHEADPDIEDRAIAAEQQCDCYVADSILSWADSEPGIDVTQCSAWPCNCD